MEIVPHLKTSKSLLKYEKKIQQYVAVVKNGDDVLDCVVSY